MRKGKDGRRFTSYYAACRMIQNKIHCDEVVDIDPTLFDNLDFSLKLEDGSERNIYMCYITDCNYNNVQWLEQTFSDMLFAYCYNLDKWILCVDHFRTPWQSVEVEVLDPNFPDEEILMLEAGE